MGTCTSNLSPWKLRLKMAGCPEFKKKDRSHFWFGRAISLKLVRRLWYLHCGNLSHTYLLGLMTKTKCNLSHTMTQCHHTIARVGYQSSYETRGSRTRRLGLPVYRLGRSKTSGNISPSTSNGWQKESAGDDGRHLRSLQIYKLAT